MRRTRLRPDQTPKGMPQTGGLILLLVLPAMLSGCGETSTGPDGPSVVATVRDKSVVQSVGEVFRFARISNGAYFFTGNAGERDIILASMPDFRFEGIGFQRLAAGSGGVPVFRFANLRNGGYFYTANPAERDFVIATRSDMRFEGSTFEVVDAQTQAAVPVSRLANLINGAYLYTTSRLEVAAAVASGVWRDEGVAFHAPTAGIAAGPAPAPSPAAGPTPRVLGQGPRPTGFDPGSGERLIRATSEVAPASNDGTGNFRTVCLPSHMAFDDPISLPRQAGASPLHVYFGNGMANASSTTQSLLDTGNSTCRGGIVNRTAYFAPAMIDTRTDGAVMPSEAHFYYKTGYLGVQPRDVQPLPRSLRMIAGNSAATAAPAPFTEIYGFSCRQAGTPLVTTIPDCAVGDEVQMTVRFPQCWDGRNIDSADHKSHMAYATGNGCPDSHPVALPEITYNILYPVRSPGQARTWRLSSDTYEGPAGFSAHASWWNAWEQSVMETFVRNCDNRGLDCHSHLLGDGRELFDRVF